LITRFSEDIDLALDRRFLGFEGNMGKNQVDNLRRASNIFIREQFFPKLQEKFEEAGFTDISFHLPESSQSDKDPQSIEIIYPSVFQQATTYIQPRILVEIGSRSLIEPFTAVPVVSFVGENFSGRPFADLPVQITCVNPERTFLEKLFLLHEEFQKPPEKIRTNRLSRHLYDIEKIMSTGYSEKAFVGPDLYLEIVQHRRTLTRINGMDYSFHAPKFLNPLPPDSLYQDWEKDYKVMQEQMIYGESLSFKELIVKLHVLKKRINNLDWKIK